MLLASGEVGAGEVEGHHVWGGRSGQADEEFDGVGALLVCGAQQARDPPLGLGPPVAAVGVY